MASGVILKIKKPKQPNVICLKAYSLSHTYMIQQHVYYSIPVTDWVCKLRSIFDGAFWVVRQVSTVQVAERQRDQSQFVWSERNKNAPDSLSSSFLPHLLIMDVQYKKGIKNFMLYNMHQFPRALLCFTQTLTNSFAIKHLYSKMKI